MSDRTVPPDISRMRSLFAWLAERDRIIEAGRLDQVLDILLDRFRRDGRQFSDIFEPSLSWDGRDWHFCRFSYAFPGFRADRAGATRTLRGLMGLFGQWQVDYLENLGPVLARPSVFMPLFGLAWDGMEEFRVKLYVQFDPGGEEILDLASSITGCPCLQEEFPGGRLHLLGLDLGPRGLKQAKLYFQHESIDWAGIRSWLGHLEPIEYLAAQGRTGLRDFLVIHRMRTPEDTDIALPREVDFPLADNRITWDELAGCRTLQVPGNSAPFRELMERFHPRFRRISFSAGEQQKVNAYYVLDGAG